jgi:hypothetical protein
MLSPALDAVSQSAALHAPLISGLWPAGAAYLLPPLPAGVVLSTFVSDTSARPATAKPDPVHSARQKPAGHHVSMHAWTINITVRLRFNYHHRRLFSFSETT